MPLEYLYTDDASQTIINPRHALSPAHGHYSNESAYMSNFRSKQPKTLTSLSIILPAYNEEQNIASTVNSAMEVAQSIVKDFEILVINDGSKDNTANVVREIAKKHSSYVRLLNNPHNMGYGATVKKGLQAGTKDWIFFTDSDGQFNLGELRKLVKYTGDYDLIVGRRKKRSDPFARKVNAWFFNMAVRVFFGIKVKDINCAFKLIRRETLRPFELTSDSAMINTELLYRARKMKAAIKEVDVTHLPRTFGKPTGANRNVILRAIIDFYKLRYRLSRGHTPGTAGPPPVTTPNKRVSTLPTHPEERP